MSPGRRTSTLFPYTTLFRSRDGYAGNVSAERALSSGLDHGRDGLRCARHQRLDAAVGSVLDPAAQPQTGGGARDRKSTRLNSSHTVISYAVFCLTKKINNKM